MKGPVIRQDVEKHGLTFIDSCYGLHNKRISPFQISIAARIAVGCSAGTGGPRQRGYRDGIRAKVEAQVRTNSQNNNSAACKPPGSGCRTKEPFYKESR